MGIIYKCTNTINNKIYIGSTTRSLEVRKHEHLKELKNNKKGGTWQEEYNYFGIKSFIFEVICEVASEDLYFKEVDLIKELNCLQPYGYNKTPNMGPNYTELDYAKASRHEVSCLIKIIDLALSVPYISNVDIALQCNVSIDTVQDLLSCKAYKWIEAFVPEQYNLVVSMQQSTATRSTFLKQLNLLKALQLYVSIDMPDKYIAELCGLTESSLRDLVRGKAYLAIKDIYPEAYKEAVSLYSTRNKERISSKAIKNTSTGEIYYFNTCAEGARLINIDARRVSDLVNGTMSKYKTYVLYKP